MTKLRDRWDQLISDTNWQKGEVIAAWCDQHGANDYDQFIRVFGGGLTHEHARRLHEVYMCFSHRRKQYKRLRWFHFYAALEWPDADRWLTAANRKNWTPGEMRMERFATA